MSDEKEIAMRQLLAEAEQLLEAMLNNTSVFTASIIRDEFVQKVEVWKEAKDNL